MIKHVFHKNIDLKKWDNCIKQSVNGSIYGSSWFLNMVCEQWNALILNDYEAVMPLATRKKMGLSYVFQPFLCQQLGVFYTLESSIIEDFIKAIPNHYLYVTTNFNVANGEVRFSIKENINFELILNKSIEDLRSNYSKSHLKNIQKARKYKLIVSNQPDSALEYSTNKRMLSSTFMSDLQFDMELKIITKSLTAGKGEIFSVKGDHSNCCSIFLLKDHNRLILLSSYANKEAKKKSAYFFLLDYIFSLDRFKGYIFDFEGSNIEGIAKRNAGFGATPKTFYTVRLNLWNRLRNILIGFNAVRK